MSMDRWNSPQSSDLGVTVLEHEGEHRATKIWSESEPHNFLLCELGEVVQSL